MPISVLYDQETNFNYIYRKTSGGTVLSANQSGATAFDYFANDAVVDDVLYFSAYYGCDFASIKLYVGTAIVADAITLVWEYWATDSTWKTLTVTDNTTGFTVLGENWVTFTPPTDWDHAGGSGAPNTGNSYCWVRCRISAVTNISEGGAQSTQLVKMKDRKITVSGGVSGTEADFEDIYTADQAAGWNVFKKHGQDGMIYESLRKIVVSGYFYDRYKIVIFASNIHHCSWGNAFYINSDGVVNFGELLSEARKTSRDGCFFFFKENVMEHNGISCHTSGTLNLYSCGFMAYTINRANIHSPNRLWNCMGTRSGLRSVKSLTDISNMIQCGTSEAIASSNPLNVDTFIAVQSPIAGPPANAESFVKNSKCRTSGNDIATWAANADLKLRLINADILWSEFNISWGGSPSGGECWRGYELFLKVVDKNNNAVSGASVLIKDNVPATKIDGTTNPDGYINKDFGTATSGSTTTVADTAKAWATNEWKGYDILITSGTGAGQRATISSNTATVLTIATVATAIDNTSKYIIVPILYHSYWNYTDGTNPQATYNPFNIEIRKAGFKTYKSDMTIEDKILGSILLDKVIDHNFSKRCRVNNY